MCNGVCKECPFRRVSAAGWLGSSSYKPKAFIGPHYHGDIRLPCHMKVNWERDDVEYQSATVGLCQGFLIMSKNSCKSHLNEEVREAQKAVEVDRENFFSFPHEFIEYHRRTNHV